jgi:hypothetical protein
MQIAKVSAKENKKCNPNAKETATTDLLPSHPTKLPHQRL